MSRSCLMCRMAHEPVRTERFMDRHVGVCPLCGKPKLSVDETHKGIALISCSVCGGAASRFAVALGITTAAFINGPEKYVQLWPLGSDANGRGGGDQSPVPLPDSARADGWCARLMANPGAMAHVRERGVSHDVVLDCRLGYGDYEHGRAGRTAFMFPCFDGQGPGSQLVGLSMRYWPTPVKDGGLSYNLRGHKAVLFPRPPSGRGVLLVCEGEWDTLAARSMGIEAVTSIAGQHGALFSRALVAGREVVVAYDAGDEEHKRARALAKRLGGRALDLRRFGPPGYDIGDLIRDRPKTFKRLIGGS